MKSKTNKGETNKISIKSDQQYLMQPATKANATKAVICFQYNSPSEYSFFLIGEVHGALSQKYQAYA